MLVKVEEGRCALTSTIGPLSCRASAISGPRKRRTSPGPTIWSPTESMVNVKKEFPSESKVIVGAEGDISYEVLVQTMDAVRETPGKDRKLLFTDVTLGAM